MRILLATLAVVAAQPLTGAHGAAAAWGGAGGDTQMVAPAPLDTPMAPPVSRVSALHGGSRPAAGASITPALIAPGVCRAADAPVLPGGLARWRLRHATTSSIP